MPNRYWALALLVLQGAYSDPSKAQQSVGAGSSSDIAVNDETRGARRLHSKQKSTFAFPDEVDRYVVQPERASELEAWNHTDEACRWRSNGDWSYSSPEHGEVHTRVVRGHSDNEICSDLELPYLALAYTWTDKSTEINSDTFTAVWTDPDGFRIAYTINIEMRPAPQSVSP